MYYINQLLPIGLVIFSGIVNLVVGIYIYLFAYRLFNKKYLSAKYLSYTYLSIFSWIFWILLNNLYIIYLNNTFILYISNIFIYISFITIIQNLTLFSVSFANNKSIINKYKFIYIIYILSLILVVIPDLFIFILFSHSQSIVYNSFAYYTIILYTLLYSILITNICINNYINTNNKNIKLNTLLLSIFSILTITLSFITNILMPFLYGNTSLIYYGPVLTLFITLAILLGILKYDLFNIKLPVASLLIVLIITLILLTIRFSIIDNLMINQSKVTILFIFMFTSLYIFLTREVYIGFKKQILLDSKKRELELALDSKNNFLKNSSHQFRTPLTVILGYLGMIINKEDSKYELNKTALEDLKKTYISANNLNNIINDVLTTNDINTGKFGVSIKDNVNLSKVIKSIINDKKELLDEKSTRVNFKVKGQISDVVIDSSKIKEAINNILDNAIFYGKGKVDITLDSRVKDFFDISIQDNGIGITNSDSKIIWKKFERGRRSPQINPNGSGLGLYLAKQIILKHGGDIIVYSAGVNKGSKFTLRIPKNISKYISTESLKNIESEV